jgi:hypothetical protein
MEDLEPGKQARLAWIKFKLELSWALTSTTGCGILALTIAAR